MAVVEVALSLVFRADLVLLMLEDIPNFPVGLSDVEWLESGESLNGLVRHTLRALACAMSEC